MMPKPLDPKTVPVRLVEQVYATWCITLPDGYTFADIFETGVWKKIAEFMKPRGDRRPKPNDLIRILDAKGTFDVTVIVRSVTTDGYVLAYRDGLRPSGTAQILNDLDGIPDEASDLQTWNGTVRKRWKAIGIGKTELEAARRTFAKANHPDAGAVNGQRLAAANSVLDAALASIQEAA
jgi:hypothetical protein